MQTYWHATRHPWPCLLFVLPLLFLYEGCMLWQALDGYPPPRAGLDAWAYSVLQSQGLVAEYLPSLLLCLVCISWSVLKWDRTSPEALPTWAGMWLESLVYALALWGLGTLMTSGWNQLSISQRANRALMYLGSGLYEEVLFRLVLFGTLVRLFELVAEEKAAVAVAVLLSATGFAAAHYLGPQGDDWHLRGFVFRAVAGGCFALLFHFRGLGVAVGTHAAYNVIVGLLTH